MEKEKEIYLKGFKEGFEAALKMAWAYANDLLVMVDNNNKDDVKEYIKKLSD